MGTGYPRWRKALQRPASEVAKILEEVGSDHAMIKRVQDIVRNRDLGSDPDAQVLEDALCLVFVETQLSDLARRVEPEKSAEIVKKTTRKMSKHAVELALRFDIADDERALLEGVLGG
jgi:hypothetical protein